MGSLLSTHGRADRNEQPAVMVEDGVGQREVHGTDAGSSSVTISTGEKSCAIVGDKSKTQTINNENEAGSPHDGPCGVGRRCDGGEKCTELAEFREELTTKRELRKSKMANIKHELDQLRSNLAEEKGKNRALIRYIQSQQHTKQTTELVTAAAVDDLTLPAASDDGTQAKAVEMSHDDSESNVEKHLEQSDDSDSSTPAPANTTDDLRLGLKKDLAESQLQLQIANGEILTLQNVIHQLRSQIQTLRTPSAEEEAAQEERNKEFRKLKADLAESQFELQISNAEVLALQSDIGQLKNQIKGLKDVIKASKEIIVIREDQVEQLKAKLRQIEDSLHERELQIMSTDLRREYERQMSNIRNLRELYEERERVSRMERDNLLRQLELRKNDLEAEQEKNKNLESHVAGMQTELETMRAELDQTKEKLTQSSAESKQLQAEMTVVNQFISKFLLGMNRQQATSGVKLDKLTEVLEENRALLIEMTKQEAETIDLGAFLPRALYDLIAEVDQEENEPTGGIDGNDKTTGSDGAGGWLSDGQKASPEQIADKLPKVWRVLIELVNHQERAEQVPFVENGEGEDCLKSELNTHGQSKMVVSVSKTYLKLKDLILEKKSLKKETNRLKTLNTHLERRLETQEKRLSAVSLELTKTWHMVGKMQRQHRQLHTQEQILRYHLQQKRRLLSELKEELEYCRLKWSAARQKNIESEDQWRILKAEFAARKKQDSLNNSGESGYSDEQPTDDEDEDYSMGVKQTAKRSPEFRNNRFNFDRCRSASLTNIMQVSLEMRKCHSETDMKSLSNVERANEFCNEKIEDLPIFPENDITGSVKKRSKQKTKKIKAKKTGPETAEEMFLRLAGLTPESIEEEDEEIEDDISEDSECSEIEMIEQRDSEVIEVVSKDPELTSEELFNMKREARLKRMAELNSRLDSYSAPGCSKDVESAAPTTDSVEFEQPTALSSTEEEYLKRRAARLERLEREAKEFHDKLSRTVNRGSEISAQIDEIHSGFLARQSESPLPGNSADTKATTSKAEESADSGILTKREQEYTQNRSERLQQLEKQSQSLINQMNRTLKKGSRLTTQLDLLHSRYGSSDEAQSEATKLEPVMERLGESSTNSMQPVEHTIVPLTASIENVMLNSAIVIPPNGPIELVLVSDEEILEEVEDLLPTPSNATSSQESDEESNGESASPTGE
ncbi:putative leucine-rich repeat-containing protein DDB_G0290503 [Malaya genurostris]|uniref:putative leucine-rich repeat-containing protein DDB_G0290503 n=1 Tax=Malaya genurostris TaxID=325434 RepID=UPI0026F3E57D|nr:putative leucine-rich repeat-containing protein DDB_G0290503 [Malaya genurostris]